MTEMYLGYTEADLAASPYARFYNPEIAPFQPQVVEAMLTGGIAHELLAPVEHAGKLLAKGYAPVETGYARTPDGGIRVSCLTRMPGVTPAMWDWWFAWHGSEAQRYRLWHPKAHMFVGWKDGRTDLDHYVGRVSHIVEYMGSEQVAGAIGFVSPSAMGLDEQRLADQGEVAICARVSFPNTPVNVGWLLHQLRPVPGGAEMRSRMWMGGANVGIGENPGPIAKLGGLALRQLVRLKLPNPAELLAHNAQEMAHLAGFLPSLYETFKQDKAAAGQSS